MAPVGSWSFLVIKIWIRNNHSGSGMNLSIFPKNRRKKELKHEIIQLSRKLINYIFILNDQKTKKMYVKIRWSGSISTTLQTMRDVNGLCSLIITTCIVGQVFIWKWNAFCHKNVTSTFFLNSLIDIRNFKLILMHTFLGNRVQAFRNLM